jgi:transcriptional regulator with XRE-family HTH domain
LCYVIHVVSAMLGVVEMLAPRTIIDLAPGEIIRDARRRAGLSQAELARRVGTAQSALSRWERGHDEPRLSRLADVLRACGLRARLVFDDADVVDRAQIRQQLALSPAERLASVTNLSRFVSAARRA